MEVCDEENIYDNIGYGSSRKQHISKVIGKLICQHIQLFAGANGCGQVHQSINK